MKRGEYWKNISKAERSIRMSYVAKRKWVKISKKDRQAWSKKLNDIKYKKLSTPKSLQKKR